MSQKSLVIPVVFEPFQLVDRPIPKPGPNDVLVKLQSVGLNPVDWKIHQLNYFGTIKYPAILGWDVAGIVEEVGANVTNFTKGDRVFHQSIGGDDSRAGFQQYALAEATYLAKVPDFVTFDEAASLPTALQTAAVGLYQKAPGGLDLTPPWAPGGKGKYSGKSIVVLGGASIVGQGAIQWARLSGFSPIVATASLSNETFLKSIGATHVVGRGATAAEEIKNVLGGATSIVWDGIANEETQKLGIAVTKSDADIILSIQPLPGLDNEGTRHIFFTPGPFFLNREFSVGLWKAISEFLESGELKPSRPFVLSGGLLSIPEGLSRLKEGKVSGGKVVVHSWEE